MRNICLYSVSTYIDFWNRCGYALANSVTDLSALAIAIDLYPKLSFVRQLLTQP